MDEEAICKKRLLTQTSVARVNADPPLKKLAKRFGALAAAAEAGGDAEETERLHSLFLRELALFEFQLARIATATSANEREQESYAAQLQQLEASTAGALHDIEALKLELVAAQQERRHLEEYEVLRTKCMQHPSRSDTLAAIDAVEKEIAELELDSAASAAQGEQRKVQYGQLLRSLDDLVAAL